MEMSVFSCGECRWWCSVAVRLGPGQARAGAILLARRPGLAVPECTRSHASEGHRLRFPRLHELRLSPARLVTTRRGGVLSCHRPHPGTQHVIIHIRIAIFSQLTLHTLSLCTSIFTVYT